MTSGRRSSDDSLESLHALIEETARNAGSDLVGFADLTTLKGILVGDATTLEFPYAVTFAVEIPEEAARASMERPSQEMREAYKVCNKKLKVIADRLAEIISDAGYKARYIDPAQRVNVEQLLGPISQKTIAVHAGMGWIGRSGLLITERFGPRQRMGAVLTDMPGPAWPEMMRSRCGDCTTCIDNCPMSVLKVAEFDHYPMSRDLVIDWAKCGEYEKRLIGDGSRPEMACGRCISVCPLSFPDDKSHMTGTA